MKTLIAIAVILITSCAYAETLTLEFNDAKIDRTKVLLEKYPLPICPPPSPTSTSCRVIPIKRHLKNIIKGLIIKEIRSIDRARVRAEARALADKNKQTDYDIWGD